MNVGVVKLSFKGKSRLSIKAPKKPVTIATNTHQIPPTSGVDRPNKLKIGAERKTSARTIPKKAIARLPSTDFFLFHGNLWLL